MSARLLPSIDGVDTILFDLGGVLFPDPWETVVLTPGTGIADRLGLDRARAQAAGPALWPHFSRTIDTEAAWWTAFGEQVGRPIPPETVAAVSHDLIAPFPAGLRLVAEARTSGRRIGVITDNTAFWYPIQARAIAIADWADPGLCYASHERGVGKKDGLFEIAAIETDPARTLVVDDRDHNIARAMSCGFRTFVFRGATAGDAGLRRAA